MEVTNVRKLLMSLLALSITSLGIQACGDDGVESLSNTEACEDICDKYETCITDIDKTECIDQCQDRADASESVEAEVEACEGCIDDTSCAEATAGCSVDCALVPIDVTAD